tara:strand:+ start:417 stop:725 length:309 start_codon:yes stop_codon:yes gene_type:complete
MRINKMIEGNLYEIKPTTIVETGPAFLSSSAPEYQVIKGWRKWDYDEKRPPFIYLGWKMENWTYHYQQTNKIHYVLWKEDIYVMDNQFAKHIIPVWDGDEDG